MRNIKTALTGSRRDIVFARWWDVSRSRSRRFRTRELTETQTRIWTKCGRDSVAFSASPTSRYAGRAPHDFEALAVGDSRRRPRHDAARLCFGVRARRADERLPFTSPQVEREVGGLIKEAKGWRVDLDDAALTIHLEMLPDHAFYFFGKEPGAGGIADRDRRPRGVPAFGRHRFAGRGAIG